MSGTDGKPSADRLAGAWAQAVARTSFVAMSRTNLKAYLLVLTRNLLDACASAEFDRAVPHDVGTALVAAHFTDVDSLEQTLRVLGECLAPMKAGPAGATRLTAVLGALAAGYAQALQERTRAEQERISASAFAARAAAEQARWNSEARFEAVFAEAVIGIGVADVEGKILEVNRALCEMLGYAPEEFLRYPIWDFIHPDDSPGIWQQVKDMLSGATNHLRLEKAYFRKDGAQIWTDLVLSLVRDPVGHPRFVVAMVENVTERHHLQIRLRHQALHDPLTGLPNRTLFFERLDAELAADDRPSVGVCYLDLDGFKAVNDTLGHDRGDHLLRAVAQRLTTELGHGGHLVARMGGDEFVVLVTGERAARYEELRRVAECALAIVRKPVQLGDHRIAISASAGVVRRDDGGTGSAALMKAADTTLCWAKKDGRDRCAVFDAERHRADVARFELSARMPEALANGEFVVEYQPLVRLADRCVIGVEALVRWDLPGGERLGPGPFVPLAEETGLIVPLGRWVLTEACRQAAAWSAADPALRLLVSVNVAARQIREPGIVADVTRILAETGLPPELLQLELTESDVMGTTAETLDTLRALAGMGIRIAIDDFGTGYSNLAYLRRLPVHALKLAGTFVTGQDSHGTDAVDLEVAGLLIRLAHVLGLSVTAESVETATQMRHLAALGCDTAQGWYFAPAMPACAIPDRIRQSVAHSSGGATTGTGGMTGSGP